LTRAVSARRVAFRRVAVSGFRNLVDGWFEPGPELNVIAGDNGQGKTSLLEALYFVATTRSFRTEKLPALVRHEQSELGVQATVEEATRQREQRARLVRGMRRVTIDGKRPPRLLEYAQRTPVVVFHPGDLELVAGASGERRRLLDRVALFVDPHGYAARAAYERAVRERQRALEERGERATELDAFEPLVAEHGARFQLARERAAAALDKHVGPAFSRLAPADLGLSLGYRPGGTTSAAAFLVELQARRRKDSIRRAPSFGPQRDELELSLDTRAARFHASQGQQRIVTLALKLAELECILEARGAEPVLLLDDVSSELDPSRTGAVYEVLRSAVSQVFVTTTRPELFPTLSDRSEERADWTVRDGQLLRTG
jgi:DNA replication and repair protein RecF